MTQRIWTIVDDQTGLDGVTVTADTEMRGVNVASNITWLNHAQSDLVLGVITQAGQWLKDNGVV